MEQKVKPTATLLSDAIGAMLRLMRGEIAYARAELEEKLRSIVTGALLILLSVAIAGAAINLLAEAAVAGLAATGLTPVQSILLIAIALISCAGLLLALGLHTISPQHLKPRRTERNLRRDAACLKEAITHDTTT